VISAGEVTVCVDAPYASARGGRNQHFALYMATQLRDEDGPVAVLSAGSDGIDGNSDAAGAIVDEHTMIAMRLAPLPTRAGAVRLVFVVEREGSCCCHRCDRTQPARPADSAGGRRSCG